MIINSLAEIRNDCVIFLNTSLDKLGNVLALFIQNSSNSLVSVDANPYQSIKVLSTKIIKITLYNLGVITLISTVALLALGLISFTPSLVVKLALICLCNHLIHHSLLNQPLNSKSGQLLNPSTCQDQSNQKIWGLFKSYPKF